MRPPRWAGWPRGASAWGPPGPSLPVSSGGAVMAPSATGSSGTGGKQIRYFHLTMSAGEARICPKTAGAPLGLWATFGRLNAKSQILRKLLICLAPSSGGQNLRGTSHKGPCTHPSSCLSLKSCPWTRPVPSLPRTPALLAGAFRRQDSRSPHPASGPAPRPNLQAGAHVPAAPRVLHTHPFPAKLQSSSTLDTLRSASK